MKFSDFILFTSMVGLGSFICVSDGLFDIPSAYYTRAHYYVDWSQVNLQLGVGLLLITSSAVIMASKKLGSILVTLAAISLVVFLANPAAWLLHDEHQGTIGEMLVKTVSIFAVVLIS